MSVPSPEKRKLVAEVTSFGRCVPGPGCVKMSLVIRIYQGAD